MGRIRGIVFDLDDTLITSSEAMHAALSAILSLLPGVSLPTLAQTLKESYLHLWSYPGAGYERLKTLPTAMLRHELTREALGRLGYSSDDPRIGEVVRLYERAEHATQVPVPGALDLLATLRPHVALGIITNGPSIVQREKLARTGLASYFDVVVADADFGAPKPDPRLFAYTAALLKLPPEELMFAGDSPEADVAGARGAGWVSVYVGAGACPEADYRLPRLTDLLSLRHLWERSGESLARTES